ncbi:MAG: terpene cyclase/mutase family protein [Saprospiraceae bacterium]|nr:terpene cyclase/mutase family protein [Saprospiraceae bacterium]
MKVYPLIRFIYVVVLSTIAFFILSCAHAERSKVKIKPNPQSIQTSLDQGITFLKNIQLENGAICDTVNPLFDMWETVLAARALYIIGSDSSDSTFRKALIFLSSNENPKGLLCHNVKCREGYCIETSSLYLQLLQETKTDRKLYTTIEHIGELQRPDGSWLVGNPDVRQSLDFPSVTAFALNAIPESDKKKKMEEKSLPWLAMKQNEGGHWGQTWEYYNVPGYALWPILQSLQHTASEAMEAVKLKAIQYILNNQEADGSWNFKDNTYPRMPSKALQTALMIAALQSAGSLNEAVAIQCHKSIEDGASYLLNSQRNDGSWDGGFFPIPTESYIKEEYVFATSLSIICLEKYKEELSKQ